jgi:hypothetical protein
MEGQAKHQSAPCDEDDLVDDGWIRIPGLFCSCQVSDLIHDGEAFHIERVGTLDQVPLFAVFRQEGIPEEKES